MKVLIMPFELSFLLLMLIFGPLPGLAQVNKITGSVRDSTGSVLSAATVSMIIDTETLNTYTDSLGKFSFPAPKTLPFKLRVSSLGYLSFTETYQLKTEKAEMDLGALVLRNDPHMLDQVEIKGKLKPVTVKTDTIEYNALAYRTQPGDRVTELVRQLPGVTIDANGDMISMGKTLTKIRVNGKDFFTGNLKDFISQLPADLVSKVQIIDDYGDQAAFTGNRIGIRPAKILNLVTKAGKNQGRFGHVKTELGTNRQYGLEGAGNYWQNNKQVSLSAKLNQADNGAGTNDEKTAGFNYRDSLGKQTNGNMEYRYSTNQRDSHQESFTETITSSGNLYLNNSNQSATTSQNHQLSLGLQHKSKGDMITGSLTGSLARNSNTSSSQLNQAGLIRQDLDNTSRQYGITPSLQGNMMYAHRFKKTGRSLSLMLDGKMASGINKNYLEDRISYYDQAGGTLIKDSLVNRLINSQSRITNLNSIFSYMEAIGKGKEGRNRSFGLNYSNSISNQYSLVDSLSYSSLLFSQGMQLFYSYKSIMLDYSFGLGLQTNLLKGRQQGSGKSLKNRNLNLMPVFDLSFRPAEGQSLRLEYMGDSKLPDFSQLQPVPDTRNLQHVIIGNPKLKAAFTHELMLEYNLATTSGTSLQILVNGSTIKNQVVSNTILLADTLGSLKQQTSFLNANGNYRYAGTYALSWPLAGNKYSIELQGEFGSGKEAFYSDNISGFNRGFNFSQGLNFRVNNKWVMLNVETNYSINANSYTLNTLQPVSTKTWLFSSDARFSVKSNLWAGIQISKTINKGYAFDLPNPLIINLDMEQVLFKKKQGGLKLQFFDLLAQGNNLKRVLGGNTITDSKMNQLTRYFGLSINYRLDR